MNAELKLEVRRTGSAQHFYIDILSESGAEWGVISGAPAYNVFSKAPNLFIFFFFLDNFLGLFCLLIDRTA